jgi:hypothetical protein
MLFVLYVAIDNLTFTEAGITLRTWTNREKEKKNWYKLLTQIDLILFCVFYVLYVRIPKRELTITLGEGKFKLNWIAIVDWRVHMLPLWFALAIV